MSLSSHILVMPALHATLNLNKKLKMKVQIAQNKCIRFCQKLDKRYHISNKEFESINWLPVNKRVHQCINAITFIFANNACPLYLNEVYEYDPQCRTESRSNFAKLKVPFRKLTWGRMAFQTLVPLYETIYPDLRKKPQFLILLSIT